MNQAVRYEPKPSCRQSWCADVPFLAGAEQLRYVKCIIAAARLRNRTAGRCLCLRIEEAKPYRWVRFQSATRVRITAALTRLIVAASLNEDDEPNNDMEQDDCDAEDDDQDHGVDDDDEGGEPYRRGSRHSGGRAMSARHHDRHAAGIYRALALRMHARYVDARQRAAFYGEDVDGPPLLTPREASDRYRAAIESWLPEPLETTAAVLALVDLAALIAADKFIGDAMREGSVISEEADALHQLTALTAVGEWLNERTMQEWVFDRPEPLTGSAP